MEMEIIILSEISQAEKDKYHVISLLCRTGKGPVVTTRGLVE
jgi:hypothetical protein